MVTFGVVLTMEIGFCQFISVCSNDLKQICDKFEKIDLKNKELTRNTLKEGIQLHEKILKLNRNLFIFFFKFIYWIFCFFSFAKMQNLCKFAGYFGWIILFPNGCVCRVSCFCFAITGPKYKKSYFWCCYQYKLLVFGNFIKFQLL